MKSARNLKAPPPKVEARLTAERADAFVRLIQAGMPPDEALGRLVAGIAPERRAVLAVRWSRDVLVLDALARLRHAPAWEDLDPDVRLGLAREKHLAELAYWLMTHAYEMLDGEGRAQAAESLKAITTYLQGRQSRSDDPFTRALKELAEERLSEQIHAQLQGEADMLAATDLHAGRS